MMDFDEFYELYRFAPVDLLKAGRGFNLQNVIEPFKKNEPTDLNKPFAEYLQSQFDDFYATMVSRHWKSGNKPKQGFKVLVHRAAMAGALYLFGWKPRSKEEVEAEKREKERLKAKAREEERRIIEERKKARLEAEEREKMQKEKDTKFLAFISSNPPIELYLSDQGYKSIDRIRIHLKELYDESFWRTPEDLVSFCQHYLREKAVAQVSAKLEKKLLKDKNLLNLFLENGMLSEDYLTDETQLIFDHNGEIEDIARKMVMNRLKLDGFYFEHCLSKLREQAG
jgi:hypothetical protein